MDEAARSRADAPVRDLFVDRDDGDAWLRTWRQRLAVEGRPDAERAAAMDQVNPAYVLRNWVAESAIRAATAGDMDELASVLECLRRPYQEQPRFARFAAPPPDWASDLALSCSS